MILALSGSLRRDSLNSAALRAAAQAAARSKVALELDHSLGTLPHFNPDLEPQLPERVAQFLATCTRAEALLLAVPEYAFGIPGAFKNALDWTVSAGALSRKRVAVVSIALPGRGARVRSALELVLRALDCDDSWHHVPIHPSLLEDDGEIRDERILRELTRVVEELVGRRLAQTALSLRSARECIPTPSDLTTKEDLMATTTPVLDGTYELDQPHSTVQFAVRHVGVSTFRASFGAIDARLVIDNGRSELHASAAVESISIGEPLEFREHVVRGDDFFAADEHPRINFRSTEIQLSGDETATVSGDLEIRGNSRPVTATGTFTPPTVDPFGGTRIGLDLRATLDRREWGLDWQMPLPAGGDALGWDVEISAQLELTKSS